MGALYSAPIRVLLLGLDSCGKTTLMRQLASRYGCRTDDEAVADAADTARVQPTYGLISEEIHLPHGGPAVTLFEIGGRRVFRDFWRYHSAQVEGVLFVVDSNDPARLEEARGFLFEVATSWELLGVPVVVMANKQDMPFALPSWRVASALQTELLEKLGHPLHVHKTIGLNGDGLVTALHVLARFVRQRRRAG